MKKLSVILATIMLVFMLFAPFTVAEQQPVFKINEAEYDGLVMHGNAVVPREGEYYVRMTFFLECGGFIVLVEKIQPNGDFTTYIATNFVAYSVLIVDRPDALVPGTFETYSWFTCTLIGQPVDVP